MSTSTLFPVVQSILPSGGEGDGLTIREVMDNLPTDPASIFVLLLLAASLAGIFWIGRPRGPKAPRRKP